MRAPPPARGPRAASRGMTLIELMTATAVMMVILTGVFAMLLTNQQLVVNHAQNSSTQASLRMAAGHIEQSLARAGYGIDPNFAVETEVMLTETTVSGVSRDGSGAFGSDELVVRYRDPLVAGRVASASAATVTLAAALPTGETLVRGQGLLILCSNATNVAYVEVASYAAQVITLAAGRPYPFNQQGNLTAACFSDGSAWMTRVERRHYFVHWFNELGGAGQRPALMLRRGLDLDGDSNVDEAPTATSAEDAEIVALDIEQLQVAYVMNRPSANIAARYQLNTGPDSNGDFVFGEPGTAKPNVPVVVAPNWSGGTTAPTPARPPLLTEANCPTQVLDENTCSLGGKRRYTGHPGNIRSVRFSLVGRWGKEDPAMAPSLLDLGPGETLATRPLENLAAADVAALPRRRQRAQRYQSTVSLRNVFQRKHFIPPVSVAGNAAGG